MVSTWNLEGRPVEVLRVPTSDPDETVRELLASLDQIRADGKVEIGIVCGGPLDEQNGVIQSPPNLPGWSSVPIVDLLSDGERRAHLMNDANAGALAEWRYGAAKGSAHMAFLTFGTGMGAGLVLDGRLYEGASRAAGEVGHWRLALHGPTGFGKTGSFEGFCSGGGIKAWAAERGMEVDHDGVRGLAQRARGGDTVAGQLFWDVGEWLGRGLALLIDLLNLEVIVLGGIYPRCEDLLREPMDMTLREEALPGPLSDCRIAASALTESLDAYASCAAAAYRVGRL